MFQPSALNPSSFNPSSFDPSLFDPSVFDLSAFNPFALDPPVFDLSAFNPSVLNPSAFDLSAISPPALNLAASSPLLFDPSQQTGQEMEPSGPGPQYTATQALPALKTQVEVAAGPENIQHSRHPTAGQGFGKNRTRWEAEREKNAALRGGNPWAMWKDKDEWEAAKWMATTKTSQSTKGLFKKIRDDMGGFGGLFGRPQFAGKMSFAPEYLYDTDDKTRLYENPWTADAY